MPSRLISSTNSTGVNVVANKVANLWPSIGSANGFKGSIHTEMSGERVIMKVAKDL